MNNNADELRQLRRELDDLMARAAGLSHRLNRIETRSEPQPIEEPAAPSATVHVAPPPLPVLTPEPVVVRPAELAAVKPTVAAPMPPPVPVPVRKPESPKKPGGAGGWEMSLGTYWIPRFAVALIALALVYFLGEAMQTFGPWFRVACGYTICAGFLVAGWFLERRYPLYARVLYAGGLGSSYFVTFAAHFIPYARIIDSLPLGLALLALVVGLWAFIAHVRRSITVAYLVTFLGHLTVMIATLRGEHLSPYSIAGIVVLALGNAFFLLKHRWYYVAVVGLVGCYANHVVWAMTVESRGLDRDFWITMSFLASYFFIYALSELFSPEDLRRKSIPTWVRTSFLTANSVCFFAVGSLTVQSFEFARPHQDIFRLSFAFVLVALGLAYLRLRDRDPLFNAYLTKAVTAATLGLAAHYGGPALTPWLAVEMVALLYSSRISGLVVTRVLSFLVAALTVANGFYVASNLPHIAYGAAGYWQYAVWAALTVLCFWIASVLYQRTDWTVRSPRTVHQPPDILAFLWQQDLISEQPKGAIKPLGGLQYPYLYALAGAGLVPVWLPALTASGDRAIVPAVLAFVLTVIAAWLTSRPLGLAAMVLSVATLGIGTYEVTLNGTAPIWVAAASAALIFVAAVRADRRLAPPAEGLVFHQHDVGAYLLYATTGWLVGNLLVREFNIPIAPTPHAAFALAGAAAVAAALTLLLHPGALMWTATGLLAWASGQWLLAGNLESQTPWHLVTLFIVALALLCDRLAAWLRRDHLIGPAGHVLVVCAAVVLGVYTHYLATPDYQFAWYAVLTFAFLGYGIAFRQITAGALSLIGAASASAGLIFYGRLIPMEPLPLLAGSALLAAFWVVLERAMASLRIPRESFSEFWDLVVAFPYFAAILLLHLPWRIPLDGAYLISSWTALAFVLVVASLPLKQVHYRYAGLAVFVVTSVWALAKVAISNLPGFNKAAAFVVLGFVLLVVAYGYHRAMLHLAGGSATAGNSDPPAEA